MSTRILITGFEPFGGDLSNASGDAVELLGRRFKDREVELSTAILPVSFRRAPEALRVAIRSHRPDVVIAVGEAGGRRVVTPETVAVNDQLGRIPDNDGARPEGPLDDGPEYLETRLDVPAIVAAIQRAGVPAEPSEDAGRFVCNAVFRAALTGFAGPAGFIHVPAVRGTAVAMVGAETDHGVPVRSGLTVEDLVSALTAVARVAVRSVQG